MSLASDLKPVVYDARGLVGEFGLRPYRAYTVRRISAGAYPGDGGPPEETVTEITEARGQPPKIRALSGEEKALLNLPGTAWEIGPITPDFPGGGTAISTLQPTDLEAGEEFYYKLVGPEYPDGALFRVVDVRSDKTFGYRVTVKPVGVE